MHFFGYGHLYHMASSLRRNPFDYGTNGISVFWFKQTTLMKMASFFTPTGIFKTPLQNFIREKLIKHSYSEGTNIGFIKSKFRNQLIF